MFPGGQPFELGMFDRPEVTIDLVFESVQSLARHGPITRVRRRRSAGFPLVESQAGR